MKIFITGGSGYLGNVLAEKLLSKFTIIIGSQKKIVSQKKKKIIYKRVNYKSLGSLKKNFKGTDAVIHLVGMNKVECEKIKVKSLIFKEKVTSNILNACKYNNVKKLIYLSSSQVYKSFQKISINEKSTVDKKTFYSKGHLLAEKKILGGTVTNYTIIRASNIFGFTEVKKKGEQKKNLVHMLCEEGAKRKIIKVQNPNIIKNFLPISTLANNIKLILRGNKFDQKIINLGSESITLYELALKIQRRFKINKGNKIRILINKKLKTKNSKHKYKSLIKKITNSSKTFNTEIDNIINLLTKKITQ